MRIIKKSWLHFLGVVNDSVFMRKVTQNIYLYISALIVDSLTTCICLDFDSLWTICILRLVDQYISVRILETWFHFTRSPVRKTVYTVNFCTCKYLLLNFISVLYLSFFALILWICFDTLQGQKCVPILVIVKIYNLWWC